MSLSQDLRALCAVRAEALGNSAAVATSRSASGAACALQPGGCRSLLRPLPYPEADG